MANEFYALAVEHWDDKNISFETDNIKALLANGTYSPDMDTDQFVSDIPSLAIIARSSNLSGKSNTGGVFNCSTFTFSLVPSGGACPYIVFYQDTGSDSTSRLLFKYDTAQGLPVTPVNQNISVMINTGPNQLARL